jgi:hypothetical protein
MSRFTFEKSTPKKQLPLLIEDGIHVVVVVQVARLSSQFAVVFEIESGDQIARRMEFSDDPSSFCFSLVDSVFNLDVFNERGWAWADFLGKSVLIRIEVRDGKRLSVTGVKPLRDGFEPLTPKSELLEFYADEIDDEVYLKLHRDIRGWVSKRVRHS